MFLKEILSAVLQCKEIPAAVLRSVGNAILCVRKTSVLERRPASME